MRSIRRLLTATAVGVAMTAGTIAVAGPAAASPEDGKGCVGTPAVPASYVCVISATPANVLPTTTSTPVPVNVPPVCYFLDCTDPSTVHVPVPGAGLNNGDLAVLWYQGRYYPIGMAVGGQVLTIAQDAIQLAGNTVDDVLQDVPTTTELLQTLNQTLAPWVTYVNNTVDNGVDDVNDTVNGLPTTNEILQALVQALRPYLEYALEWVAFAQYTVDNLPTTNELLQALVEVLRPYAEVLEPWVDFARELVNDPPTTGEILAIIRDTEYYYILIELARYVVEQLPDVS